MASHYTWDFVTTLRDFGGVLGWPLDISFWALTISWSWLLARVWSGPKFRTPALNLNALTHMITLHLGHPTMHFLSRQKICIFKNEWHLGLVCTSGQGLWSPLLSIFFFIGENIDGSPTSFSPNINIECVKRMDEKVRWNLMCSKMDNIWRKQLVN